MVLNRDSQPMCNWGNTVQVQVIIPPNLSHTNRQRIATKDIDACIAPIVQALQCAGIHAHACCCGHGKHQPEILLENNHTLTAPTINALRHAANTLINQCAP